MGLSGKVAVVTGGAKGIGKAIALQLAEHGADVAIFDTDLKGADVVSEKIAGLGRRSEIYDVDVADRERVKEAVRHLVKDFGHVDILVNNAGIWRGAPLLEMAEAEFDAVMAVNVKGPLLCVQAVAPYLIEQRSGKIVNVASVAGLKGSSPWGAYCASKAALINMTQTLAAELAPHHVQCNAFLPGATRTPLLDQIMREEPGNTYLHALEPEEVARQVLELIIPYEQTRMAEAVAVRRGGD